jgi:cobalt-precorrin-5B (C1)-methyltransferase
MDLMPVPEGPLRTGYTTGACATAATQAALISLLTQAETRETEIILPRGERVVFRIESCVFGPEEATCTTRKDAGDDPDVTHGAIIGSRVRLSETPGIRFLRGDGVGIVTLPGLSSPVGEPAINKVPRQMMQQAVARILERHGETCGADVTVFVPQGEELAGNTLNARLGILGGISILGTTGIVTPFSSSSYIASIRLGIDVCLANSCPEIVINAGARSEGILRRLFPRLPEYAFIHYGNWIGETLDMLATSGCGLVHMGIMLGKAVKLAQGQMDTHSGKSTLNREFLYGLARECGYGEEKRKDVMEITMAGTLTRIFPFSPGEPFYRLVVERAHEACLKRMGNKELRLILLGEDGTPLFQNPRYKESAGN